MIWLILLAFLCCPAIVGFYQGGIRMTISFIGLIAGAALALPLSNTIKPALAPFGLAHPVLNSFVAPFIVFVIIQIIFKVLAVVAHRKIDNFYKYNESDTKRSLWLRLNERTGLCVGLLNGTTYFVLFALVMQIFGYLTMQLATSDTDPKVLRFANAFNAGLSATGMDKPVSALNPSSTTYFDAADVLGDFFHQPLLQSRLANYPPFLTMAEKSEFQELANDTQLQELLQKQPTAADVLNHPKIKPLIKNPEIYKELMNLLNNDLGDLRTYLVTAKSPRYDSEKILGRWQLSPNASIAEARKHKARLPVAEITRLKAILTPLQDAILTATIDNKIIVRIPTPEEVKRFEGSWKGPEAGQYSLTLSLDTYIPKPSGPIRPQPQQQQQTAEQSRTARELASRYGTPQRAQPAASEDGGAEAASQPQNESADNAPATVDNNKLIFKLGSVHLVFVK